MLRHIINQLKHTNSIKYRKFSNIPDNINNINNININNDLVNELKKTNEYLSSISWGIISLCVSTSSIGCILAVKK